MSLYHYWLPIRSMVESLSSRVRKTRFPFTDAPLNSFLRQADRYSDEIFWIGKPGDKEDPFEYFLVQREPRLYFGCKHVKEDPGYCLLGFEPNGDSYSWVGSFGNNGATPLWQHESGIWRFAGDEMAQVQLAGPSLREMVLSRLPEDDTMILDHKILY